MTVIPLPEHLRNRVRIAWHISNWCNYSCQYCGVLVFLKRAKDRQKQAHAFDHYPVEQWLEAFRKFPQDQIYLKITGGEPFLDRIPFRTLLAGLTADERFTLRIDTNGTWDPAFFREIPKERILLNISFHPNETTLDAFLPRLKAIRNAGFTVSMVNFVLAPENMDASEEAISRLEGDGFFVNVGAMISTGIYGSREIRTKREVEILEKYNTPLDLYYRLVNPVTKDRPCFHPALSYYMLYDGSIKVDCVGNLQNLFTDGLPPLPREAVSCPYTHCYSCMEMYRAIPDESKVKSPLGLYPLDEYVRETREWRRTYRWKALLRKLPLAGRLAPNGSFSLPVSVPDSTPVSPLLTVDAIQPALPEQPVFGTVEGGVSAIEARSRDRIALSGWVASRSHGAPIQSLRITLAERELGVVREFHERPDIAARFGRANFSRSGWRTMVYIPSLEPGEYSISVHGVAPSGESAQVWNAPVRIVD